MSTNDRANKSKKILSPLEKSLTSINENKTVLSHCTPEEKEMLQAWRNSVTSLLTKEIEAVKCYGVERDLTKDDFEHGLEALKSAGALSEEADKHRTTIANYFKTNG